MFPPPLPSPLTSLDSWLSRNNIVSGFRYGKDEYLMGDILHGAISGLSTEFDLTYVSTKTFKTKT